MRFSQSQSSRFFADFFVIAGKKVKKFAFSFQILEIFNNNLLTLA